MKKSLLLSFIFVLAFVLQTYAQSRTVTGRVTSAVDGSPLPGVTVLLKGSTTTGTTTDIEGNFSLSVPEGRGTLVFSLVGSETREVAIGNQSSVSVSLNQATTGLSEVVVVGYSTTTQQAFTGSAKVVSSENLDRKNVANVSQALAGEVAGVRVINTSGQPGTVATVRIRGIGSVTGNRDPLYVVDGVPFSGSINSINPEDIQNVTVLKDAAATAIYGSRGANGVIVITTKTGRGQNSFIEVDGNYGTNMALLPRYSTIKSPEQFISLAWESLYNQGTTIASVTDPVAYANTNLFKTGTGISSGYNLWNVADGGALIDPETRMVRSGVTRKYDPENWEDFAFQNSARREVNVKFGGSSGKTNYFSSFGYLNDKGYSIGSDYQRLSARLNLTQEIKSWITGSFNVGYANSERNVGGQTEDSNSIFWFVDNIPSIFPLYLRDAEGKIVTDPILGGNQFDYGGGGNMARGFGGLTNAIADAQYNTRRHNRNELNGAASLNLNILDGLTLENRLGAQFYQNNYVSLTNKYYGSAASQKGNLGHTRSSVFNYNLLNMLRYSKTFGQHSVEALAAHEATDWRFNTLSASGYNLVTPDNTELSNAVVKTPSSGYSEANTIESWFSQLNYDFEKKYFLSATIRRDGSSKFRESDNKWSTFGSVGAAWLISNEDFMSTQSIFSSLKLKASYGLMGDQAGLTNYPGYDFYNVNNVNNQPAFAFNTKGNPDLTWETSKMFQTGIEFGLGNYLTGSVDYYIKNTTDLIFAKRVPISLGYAIINVNEGVLKNQGLEFDLTGHILKSKDYRLNLSVNGEMFTNKLTAMPLSAETGKEKAIDVQGLYGWAKGHSIYDFYIREFTGVDPADGKSTWTVIYNDLNNDNVPDTDERVANLVDFLDKNPNIKEGDLKTGTTKVWSQATLKYSGKSALPKVRGAFNLSGGFKGFDLGIQMLYSVGGYSYDGAYAGLMSNGTVGTNNWHTDILNRWQKPGDETDVPRLSNSVDQNVNSASTRFLTKAHYLILNNVRLSYTIPTSLVNRFGVGGLSVWVSGDNLWINSARKGFNPSTSESGASDTYLYSPLSTVTAGLRVKI